MKHRFNWTVIEDICIFILIIFIIVIGFIVFGPCDLRYELLQ